MRKFENRKLFLLLSAGIAVFSLYSLVPFFRGIIIIPIIFAAVIFYAIFGGAFEKFHARRSVVFILAAMFFISLCASRAFFTVRNNSRGMEYIGEEKRSALARITYVSYTGEYSALYYADITSVDGKDTDFSAVIYDEGTERFEYGDTIFFDATFSATEDDDSYLNSKGIFIRAESANAHLQGKADKDIFYYLHNANEYISDRMVSFIGEEEGGFCSALILGNRSLAGADIKLAFSRAGISHILSLSGMHLSVLAFSLNFILKGVLKKRIRNVVLIFSCFAFAAFTGFSASVTRAAIMLSFVFVSEILGEQNDSLTALSAAAFLILLFNGNAVYDVGFWLSFAATLGIIVTVGALQSVFYKWKKPVKSRVLRALYYICKYFYGMLTVSLAASFFTLPIIYFAFGEVSLIGAVSNFFFIPVATLLIILCALFIPLSYVP
ncbi:MAG: ComEC/Rec2 family competence protein, partial [Eubacteriales bacterium]